MFKSYTLFDAAKDVQYVMSQAQCSEADAIEALRCTDTVEDAVIKASVLVAYYKEWGAQ